MGVHWRRTLLACLGAREGLETGTRDIERCWRAALQAKAEGLLRNTQPNPQPSKMDIPPLLQSSIIRVGEKKP